MKAVGNKMGNNIYDNMSKEQIINVLEQIRWERDVAIKQLQNGYGMKTVQTGILVVGDVKTAEQ